MKKQGIGDNLMPEAGKKTLELKNIEFVVLEENSLFLVICLKTKKTKTNETWGCGLHRFDCTDEIIQKLY